RGSRLLAASESAYLAGPGRVPGRSRQAQASCSHNRQTDAADTRLHHALFTRDDSLLFGPETRGLPALEDLGFLGAVLAFPGVNEARYSGLSVSRYGRAGSPRASIFPA
ncbi:MAG: hypothetical protein LBC79_09690, partial [Deltaproteobacteria bacterium]|nr:hypothetical protein [Deltaproteobacteria bacterium]